MVVDPKTVAKPVAKPVAVSKVSLDPGITQDQEQENTVQEAAALGYKRHHGPWFLLSKDKKENRKLVLRHSHAGNLKGHDHKTGEVMLVDPDFEAPKTAAEIEEEEIAAKGPTAGIKG